MFRQISRILALTVALLLPAAAGAEVRIGLANPLTGPYAASGERNRVAVQLAIAALNQAGGVLGQQVRLVVVDDGCDSDRAAAAALELVKAGVGFVVGHMCSHASLTAAPIYEAAGVPMMSPDSTHPQLTEEGRGNIFRLAGRDDLQGRLAGDWLAYQRPPRRIAIVHDQSTYGRGLAERARERLREHGISEALFASYEPGQATFAGLVEELQRAEVEVLFVGGYGPDAGRLIRAARDRGSRVQLVGGDGLAMEEFWAAAGAAGEGAVFTARPDLKQIPAAAKVLDEFRAMGLGPLPWGLAAYAAVEVWAAAAGRAGTVDPGQVTKVIHRGRFATALGRVAFDVKGDVEGADWQWQIWHDGFYAPFDPPVAMR
jgi:branched-chain amino acid transport system substrate-binding protein